MTAQSINSLEQHLSAQAPILIVLLPFFAALLICVAGQRRPKACFALTVAALLGAWSASAMVFAQVIAAGPVDYLLGGWPPPFGIQYQIDVLNGIVLILVTSVALLTAVYSLTSVPDDFADNPRKIPLYYSLYLLLITGLLGMTITVDAFNLYVLLEISSLATYALIAIRRGRAVMAAFQYIIMGTIGASFYLLGVGYIYIKTGTLNMIDIHAVITETGLAGSNSILVAFILIMVGVWIKMAFFPLHGWLPNAYTFAPSTSGAVLAPLMTKVTIYVMLRMMLTVFGVDYLLAIDWSSLVVGMAVLAIVAGSLFALAQQDLKKMLCYIIISEVGYMVGGAWLLNESGMIGAVYHIASDALMTLCLFLAAGAIITRTRDHDLSAMKGLYGRMPLTMVGFTMGGLSMIGLPPTCGFVSKWYLIRGGMESGQWHYVAALLFASLINVVLFFRIFELAFFQLDDEDEHRAHANPQREEAPLSMLIPLLTASASLLLLGVFNERIVGLIRIYLSGPFS